MRWSPASCGRAAPGSRGCRPSARAGASRSCGVYVPGDIGCHYLPFLTMSGDTNELPRPSDGCVVEQISLSITRHKLTSTGRSESSEAGLSADSVLAWCMAGILARACSSSSQVSLRDRSAWFPPIHVPASDDGTIDPRLQQVHSHGVSQSMNGDPLLTQRGQTLDAVSRCLFSRYCTPWTVRRSPAFGNNTSPSPRGRFSKPDF